MSQWIKCSDRMPEIIYSDEDGSLNNSVNSVLVLYEKDTIECGSRIQVANTVWANKRHTCITHWMPLPPLPKE